MFNLLKLSPECNFPPLLWIDKTPHSYINYFYFHCKELPLAQRKTGETGATAEDRKWGTWDSKNTWYLLMWPAFAQGTHHEHLDSGWASALCKALCQGTAVPGPTPVFAKNFSHFLGIIKAPLHIHHQIIAWRRDGWNHVFYKHLKALPPVDSIWHHLHLGPRRFRAFAFVFKGRRKETLQLSKRTSLMLCFWPQSYRTQNSLWSSSFLHEWHCKVLFWCLSKHFK